MNVFAKIFGKKIWGWPFEKLWVETRKKFGLPEPMNSVKISKGVTTTSTRDLSKDEKLFFNEFVLWYARIDEDPCKVLPKVMDDAWKHVISIKATLDKIGTTAKNLESDSKGNRWIRDSEKQFLSEIRKRNEEALKEVSDFVSDEVGIRKWVSGRCYKDIFSVMNYWRSFERPYDYHPDNKFYQPNYPSLLENKYSWYGDNQKKKKELENIYSNDRVKFLRIIKRWNKKSQVTKHLKEKTAKDVVLFCNRDLIDQVAWNYDIGNHEMVNASAGHLIEKLLADVCADFELIKDGDGFQEKVRTLNEVNYTFFYEDLDYYLFRLRYIRNMFGHGAVHDEPAGIQSSLLIIDINELADKISRIPGPTQRKLLSIRAYGSGANVGDLGQLLIYFNYRDKEIPDKMLNGLDITTIELKLKEESFWEAIEEIFKATEDNVSRNSVPREIKIALMEAICREKKRDVEIKAIFDGRHELKKQVGKLGKVDSKSHELREILFEFLNNTNSSFHQSFWGYY